VVEEVFADPALLEELYRCYQSDDELVRLRTSNGMKRVWRAHPDWMLPYVDRMLTEASQIHQDSTRWTIAQMIEELGAHFTTQQHQTAVEVLKRNLDETSDWIVVINTLRSLKVYVQADADLKVWLKPYVERFAADPRKTVAREGRAMLKALYGG
jgi:hypothetical protein